MNAILLFFGGIGMQEILMIGLFVFFFFGAKKIPDIMKGLGKGIRDFKDSVKETKTDIEKHTEKPEPLDAEPVK